MNRHTTNQLGTEVNDVNIQVSISSIGVQGKKVGRKKSSGPSKKGSTPMKLKTINQYFSKLRNNGHKEAKLTEDSKEMTLSGV